MDFFEAVKKLRRFDCYLQGIMDKKQKFLMEHTPSNVIDVDCENSKILPEEFLNVRTPIKSKSI
jgi:hypothetical protein